MKRIVKILPLMAVIAVFAFTVLSTETAQAKETDTIPETVYIGEVNVSNMTQEEAKAELEEYIDSLGSTKFMLKTENNQVTTTAKELGITIANDEVIVEALGLGKTGNMIERYKAKKDLRKEAKVFELKFAADKEKVSEVLNESKTTLNIEAVNATMTRQSSSFEIIGGTDGEEIELSSSITVIEDYILNEWDGADAIITLPTKVTKPKGSKDELEKVQDLLGSYHTDFSSSASGRAKNVQNGAQRVNGHVIYPGEQFSVYEAVSPFDAENGYELAGSYENGTVVETYGGGICQVSTTLYNAAILAELQIDERSAHSMVVSYVKPSMDAAIAGTHKDLKFSNNTDAPIYIEGYTSGGVLYFNIFGEETRDENRVVTYESEITSQTDPGVQIVADSNQPVGYVATTQSSHTGYTAVLWKVVTIDGKEESRTKFNSSSYRASNKIVTVGVATADEEANAQITAAVFSGDEATCRAVAAAYAGR